MTLHTSEQPSIVALWTSISHYVPVKDRRAAADQFIATVDEAELIDFNNIGTDLYGECDLFDKALRQYIQDNGYEIPDWEE
jgi:hypothetical protein